MGAIYRVTYTNPLPAGAELFTRAGERLARWTDRKGRKRTAKVTVGRDGSDRIVMEAATHVAKFRDGAGVVRTVKTGCRMKDAAAAVLKGLTDCSQLVKANVITPAQDAAADHAVVTLPAHLDAYGAWQGAFGNRGNPVSPMHRANTEAALRRLVADCGWQRLGDLSRPTLEAWLSLRLKEGMSAARRNGFLKAAVAFANWCVENGRLVANPSAGRTPKRTRGDGGGRSPRTSSADC